MKTKILIFFLVIFSLSAACHAEHPSFAEALQINKAMIMLESRDEFKQEQGYKDVKELGEITIPYLIKALGDKNINFDSRALMCDLLGEWKADKAVTALVGQLDCVSTKVRAAACGALGKIGDPEAVLPLSRVVTDDSSQGVRQVSALALGEIGSDKALPALIIALRDDYKSVQVSALHSLKKITGEDFDRSYGEWQNWYNYSSAFAGPLSVGGREEVFVGPADVGFSGFTLMLGLDY